MANRERVKRLRELLREFRKSRNMKPGLPVTGDKVAEWREFAKARLPR